MVTFDRWSSYTVMILWEFAWADSALVVLDEWPSYRGGCLNRFDCTIQKLKDKTVLNGSSPIKLKVKRCAETDFGPLQHLRGNQL